VNVVARHTSYAQYEYKHAGTLLRRASLKLGREMMEMKLETIYICGLVMCLCVSQSVIDFWAAK